GLVVCKDCVPVGRGLGGGLLCLRAGSGNGGWGGRCGRTPRDRRFQEITPAEARIRHVFLPASGSTSWCQRSFLAWAKMRHFRLRRQGCSMQGLLRPISKVAMVCRRLRGCTVVPNSLTGPRARGRNPNAGATQRRRTNLGTADLAGRRFCATSRKP